MIYSNIFLVGKKWGLEKLTDLFQDTVKDTIGIEIQLFGFPNQSSFYFIQEMTKYCTLAMYSNTKPMADINNWLQNFLFALQRLRILANPDH